MSQLNAYAPAIVGAVSVVIVAASALWIASRPPKSCASNLATIDTAGQ